jgi:3-oxoadipate enol-lactonase
MPRRSDALSQPILHHQIQGTGPRVVLLHPVGLDLTFLAPVASILSKNFTVLSVDARGHGQSPAEPPARSLEDFADDLHALLERLSFAPSAIVGFSFGGMVTMTLPLKYPKDASALVICACSSTHTPQARAISAARGSDAEKGGMRAVLDATLERWFNDDFRLSGRAEAARKRLLSENVSGWAHAWRAMSCIDTLPRLGEIRTPTLCVAGEYDKSSPPAVVRQIADAIPGAQFAVLPRAPHMLFIEQPREVADVIGGFLREVLKDR